MQRSRGLAPSRVKILPLYQSLFSLCVSLPPRQVFHRSDKSDNPCANAPCSCPEPALNIALRMQFLIASTSFLAREVGNKCMRNAWVGLLHRQVAWCLDEGACRTRPTPAERLTRYRFKSDSTSRRELQTRHSQDMNKKSTNRSVTVRTIKPHAGVTGRSRRVCVDECEMPCTNMRRLTSEIRSGKCFVWRFRRCTNVKECTYTNLHSTVQPTTHLGYMV
jgi:hypothetical protein